MFMDECNKTVSSLELYRNKIYLFDDAVRHPKKTARNR
jgi:hypothetical protein